MKRRDLIRHLEQHSCVLDQGARHSIYRNPANGRCAAVPPHRKIIETQLARDFAINWRW